MVETEPERGRGRELGIAAADPAAGKEHKSDARTAAAAPAWASMSLGLMPLIKRHRDEAADQRQRDRFEMVMVKRSLEAANAIKAGNTRSRIASVSMTIPLQRSGQSRERLLRFRYRRPRNAIHLRRGSASRRR